MFQVRNIRKFHHLGQLSKSRLGTASSFYNWQKFEKQATSLQNQSLIGTRTALSVRFYRYRTK